MLADYHVHTSFSPDSMYPMKDCIEKAISLGINEMCFTEHIDKGCVNAFCCNCEDYHNAFLRYKNIYQDQITLKFGIEFGVQTHHKDYFQHIFESYPFDFVLMSFHQVEDKELWNQDFQSGKTQEQYYRIYFDEMLNSAKSFHDFSVLAHMDLLKRYEIYGNYSFENYKQQVEDIFKYIIPLGKGIEVNTSSFRYGLDDLTPSVAILKLYKELGGEIITIGSDSHCENHLGKNILYVREILKGLGYRYFATFDAMEPIFNKL